MKIFGWILLGFFGLILIGFIGLWVAARIVGTPKNLGVTNGKLAPCPESPNCVSTMSDKASNQLPPIPFSIPVDSAKNILLNVIRGENNVRIISQDAHYLHAVFTIPIFGFKDDVEFYLDEKNKQLHFRSASRVGGKDLGVNKKRMEEISQKLLSHPGFGGNLGS